MANRIYRFDLRRVDTDFLAPQRVPRLVLRARWFANQAQAGPKNVSTSSELFSAARTTKRVTVSTTLFCAFPKPTHYPNPLFQAA